MTQPTATVTVAMTPDVRAIVDETVRLHAEVAAELRAIADDLKRTGFDVSEDRVVGPAQLWRWEHRLTALADRLAAPTGTGGGEETDVTEAPITIRAEDVSDATLTTLLTGIRGELPAMLAGRTHRVSPAGDPRSHRLLAAGLALVREATRRGLIADESVDPPAAATAGDASPAGVACVPEV
jgi:hypothetical protein